MFSLADLTETATPNWFVAVTRTAVPVTAVPEILDILVKLASEEDAAARHGP